MKRQRLSQSSDDIPLCRFVQSQVPDQDARPSDEDTIQFGQLASTPAVEEHYPTVVAIPTVRTVPHKVTYNKAIIESNRANTIPLFSLGRLTVKF